jgi:CubicO group peptidase (beta-lactamase class C family)
MKVRIGVFFLCIGLLTFWQMQTQASPENGAPSTAKNDDSDWQYALIDNSNPALEAFEKFLFPGSSIEVPGTRKGPHTDGVVILQNGKLVYEKYANGFNRNQRHLTWSMSKSVLNSMVGMAVLDGKLKLDDSICKFQNPKWFVHPEHCGITIRHLLEWRTGIKWNESYEGNSDPASSDVLQMLYNNGARDMGRYVSSRPLEAAPGSMWRYSSGDANYLSLVLKWVYGKDYKNLVYQRLFGKLGMTSAFFETDRSGTFVAASYVYATPRDLAKFGQLYLQDGIWKGERILPEGWVSYSSTPHMQGELKDVAPGDALGGALFWTNRPAPELNLPSAWKDAPTDTFAAMGHWAQRIFVIPSRQLVIVRVGDTRDGSFNDNEFLRLALQVTGQATGSKP